jgi:anaerobic magnesium-protoporphyrin IX monomethyl ester cyclase
MKVALINPAWTFKGSIYFGCREAHFPLEFGYAQQLLAQAGHDSLIIDAQLENLSLAVVKDRVENLAPDLIVVTTAPSYLFWRCPPPELLVPMATVAALRPTKAPLIAVGPHASATPGAACRKLGVDLAIRGEFEEVLVDLAGRPRSEWNSLASLYSPNNPQSAAGCRPHAANMQTLPPLTWPPAFVRRHTHHHHRFEAAPLGPGAEMETSRGCPFGCAFCARTYFRRTHRPRPLETILVELDGLIRQGVEYVYFIDEMFFPRQDLLQALTQRSIKFGIQTRIELWDPDQLTLLGQAGCVSIEAGVESLEESGRILLRRNTPATLEAITQRLILAKMYVPFVQANLMDIGVDDLEIVAAWRRRLQDHGVWASQPVPVFFYPGSPGYAEKWGEPDDRAWERAHEDYLRRHAGFSDIQDQSPLPLLRLEEAIPWGF